VEPVDCIVVKRYAEEGRSVFSSCFIISTVSSLSVNCQLQRTRLDAILSCFEITKILKINATHADDLHTAQSAFIVQIIRQADMFHL